MYDRPCTKAYRKLALVKIDGKATLIAAGMVPAWLIWQKSSYF